MSNAVYKYSTGEKISNNIKNLIASKHKMLSEQINFSIIFLFWQIGNELNQANIKLSGRSYIGNFFCKKMSERFGRLFVRTNLTVMQVLADQFPDLMALHKMSVILNWNDIRLLLKIDDPGKRNFYFKQIIRQQIHSKQLKNKIFSEPYTYTTTRQTSLREDLFKEVDRAFKENRNRYFSALSVFNTPIKNLLLLELSEDLFLLSGEEKRAGQNDILSKVNQIVHGFIRQQNNFLHTQFNLLRWEIGKFILSEALASDYQERIREISLKLSTALGKKHNECFDAEEMDFMARLAGKVVTEEGASIISSALDWTQIKILISCVDPDSFFFYAKLAITKKLNDQTLRRVVKGSDYTHFLKSGGQVITESEFVSNFITSKDVQIHKKRNSVMEIKFINYTTENNKQYFQVFKNECFIKFISLGV